jgi:hypothetical protein
VDPGVGRDRADDPGARGAVPADVSLLVLHDLDPVVGAPDDRDRALHSSDEWMAGLDPAVDDADVDSAARAADGPGAGHALPPACGRVDDGRLPGREAPGRDRPRAHRPTSVGR